MTEKNSTFTISARSLSRDFGAYTAVREINLELKRGEVLGFLGPNGAGKTTTMHMLTGNLAPSSGSVEICGIDLLDKPRVVKHHLPLVHDLHPITHTFNL